MDMCIHVCFPCFHRASMKYVHPCPITLDLFVSFNVNVDSLAWLDSLAQKGRFTQSLPDSLAWLGSLNVEADHRSFQHQSIWFRSDSSVGRATMATCKLQLDPRKISWRASYAHVCIWSRRSTTSTAHWILGKNCWIEASTGSGTCDHLKPP